MDGRTPQHLGKILSSQEQEWLDMSRPFVLNRRGQRRPKDPACVHLPAGSLEGKVALVKAGRCSFGWKLLNVFRAGAVGAIVYHHEDCQQDDDCAQSQIEFDFRLFAGQANQLEEMGAGPVMFVSNRDGMTLRNLAEEDDAPQIRFICSNERRKLDATEKLERELELQQLPNDHEADWFTCAREGQDCYCNGNVRYGSGDNWYMRTDNVDRIRCSSSSFGNNYVANAHCECLTDQCIRPHEGKRYEIDCGFWWWDTCGEGCRAYDGCRGACCKVQQDYCEGDNSCLSDRSCRGAETEEALALPIKNLDAMESANALSPKSTSFSFGDATYFLAGIGFAAALYGVAKYSKPSKYQEIESEI